MTGNVKISDLTAATSVNNAAVLPFAYSGTTYKITYSNFKTDLLSGLDFVESTGGATSTNQLPVFSGTSGDLITPSTVTGLLLATAGVISAATAGTDYVTASSTNTFTNKTFDTAGTGNSFLINGLAASANTGTGSVVRSTSPTISSPTITTPNLVGTVTNNNAAIGSVGELIESSISAGSAVSLSTGTTANVTTISLTAGDWDVWGAVNFTANAATTANQYVASINTTSATLPTAPGSGAYSILTGAFGAGLTAQALQSGLRRISISGTTTVYLLAQSTFAVNTMAAYGYIGARRVR